MNPRQLRTNRQAILGIAASFAGTLFLEWNLPMEAMRFALRDTGFAVLFDACDSELISRFRWITRRGGDGLWYAKPVNVVDGFKPGIEMHRLVLGESVEGKVVDHIDGNGLNNQKANLRACTPSQNRANSRKQRGDFSSRFKGVSRRPGSSRWRAWVVCDGVHYYCGMHATEVLAALAYNKKASELFGEFARLNDLSDSTQEQPANA